MIRRKGLTVIGSHEITHFPDDAYEIVRYIAPGAGRSSVAGAADGIWRPHTSERRCRRHRFGILREAISARPRFTAARCGSGIGFARKQLDVLSGRGGLAFGGGMGVADRAGLKSVRKGCNLCVFAGGWISGSLSSRKPEVFAAGLLRFTASKMPEACCDIAGRRQGLCYPTCSRGDIL